MGKLRKKPAPTRTLRVALGGDLEGHEVVMRAFTTADYIRIRRGDLDDVALLEMTLAGVIDSTFDDVHALEPKHVLAILDKWVDAQREEALPPA